MIRAEECEKKHDKETNLHLSANDEMSKLLHTHPQSKYAVEENYMEHLETQSDPSPTCASSSWITGNRCDKSARYRVGENESSHGTLHLMRCTSMVSICDRETGFVARWRLDGFFMFPLWLVGGNVKCPTWEL